MMYSTVQNVSAGNYYFFVSTNDSLLTRNGVIYVIRSKSLLLVLLLNMYFGYMVVMVLMTISSWNKVVGGLFSSCYQPSWSLKESCASCRKQWNCQTGAEDACHHGHCLSETASLYTYIQSDRQLHLAHMMMLNYILQIAWHETIQTETVKRSVKTHVIMDIVRVTLHYCMYTYIQCDTKLYYIHGDVKLAIVLRCVLNVFLRQRRLN